MSRTLPSDGLAPIDVYMEGETSNRGCMYIDRYHTVSGGSYANTARISTTVDTTVTYPTTLYVRMAIEDGASIGSMYGIWINSGTPNASATVGNYYDISITHSGSTVPSYEALFRLYNSSTSAALALDSVFHLANNGGSPFTNLFDFEAAVIPVMAYSTGTTVGYRIACLVGATTYYLHLFTS